MRDRWVETYESRDESDLYFGMIISDVKLHHGLPPLMYKPIFLALRDFVLIYMIGFNLTFENNLIPPICSLNILLLFSVANILYIRRYKPYID